jgi:hypothetical protein
VDAQAKQEEFNKALAHQPLDPRELLRFGGEGGGGGRRLSQTQMDFGAFMQYKLVKVGSLAAL